MIPKFTAVDFVSFYIQIPLMIVMFIVWMLVQRPGARKNLPNDSVSGSGDAPLARRLWYSDLVDVDTVDLFRDEYVEEEEDKTEDELRKNRVKGKKGFLWRLYYWVA